ncbi:hypothetical protein FRC07_003638, partial [Ceratobasidium sp. 392]
MKGVAGPGVQAQVAWSRRAVSPTSPDDQSSFRYGDGKASQLKLDMPNDPCTLSWVQTLGSETSGEGLSALASRRTVGGDDDDERSKAKRGGPDGYGLDCDYAPTFLGITTRHR